MTPTGRQLGASLGTKLVETAPQIKLARSR